MGDWLAGITDALGQVLLPAVNLMTSRWSLPASPGRSHHLLLSVFFPFSAAFIYFLFSSVVFV
jgi:hypothetical protein